MAEFIKPAVKIMQGKRTLFLTSLTVRDFMTDGFYRVDHLDVQSNTGMQRLLNKARARSFGKDIIGADKHNEAFLPTSVFLATGGSIDYDKNTKEMSFDSAYHVGVCPLDVVDGQHRIEGLIYAAKEDKHLLDFPVSAVIAPNMSEAEKMLQFVVVNTKQSPVDPGVAQHITSRFTKMLGVEELPYLPDWLAKQAKKGDVDRALEIAREFNNDTESPWYRRIQFADETKGERHTIKQASFVQSINRIILARNHLIGDFPESKRVPIMLNYWRAVSSVCVARSADSDTGVNSVVFKSVGLEFFNLVMTPVLRRLARKGMYSEEKMKECLMSVQDYLPQEAAGVLSPEFWQSGSVASGLNKGAIQNIARHFTEAMSEVGDDDIQL